MVGDMTWYVVAGFALVIYAMVRDSNWQRKQRARRTALYNRYNNF